MIKLKNIIFYFIIIFIIPINISAGSDEIKKSDQSTYITCNTILNKTKINLKTRSKNGWLRLIKNNGLQNYTNYPLSEQDIFIIKNCIEIYGNDCMLLNRGNS